MNEFSVGIGAEAAVSRCSCWLAFFIFGLLLARSAQAGKPAVAFFYGKPVPVADLRHFDWVVVQPDNLDPEGLAELNRARVEVFAYLSMGEAAAHDVEPGSVVGSNPGWNSVIVNPAAASWREQILARADSLAERGYRGLFLDTLDSYVAALPGAQARRAAAVAMGRLVAALHERHPELRLFFNRGFEILGEVGDLASAVAAESLFFGWDAVRKEYVEVSEADRKWLTAQLRGVKERYGIPIVVIDYVPTARRHAGRVAARRINALGFTPWVSNASLDALGVGSVEVIPRRVLLLYDGAETPSLEQSPIHRLAALPIEYLGCAADYLDIRRGLPREPLAGRYAGIVTWFTDDELPDELGYPRWLAEQMDAGIRVAILGRPGFPVSKSFLARLGLAATVPARPLRLAERDDLIGFEAAPQLRSRALLGWHDASGTASVHLRLEDARGQSIDPVLTTAWGGLALDPYVIDVGYEGRTRWIVDPFSFLEQALGLEAAPALDFTTENGAPLLVVVADGAGSLPAGDAAISAHALLEDVLSAPIAATVNAPAPAARDRESDSLARALFTRRRQPSVRRGAFALGAVAQRDSVGRRIPGVPAGMEPNGRGQVVGGQAFRHGPPRRAGRAGADAPPPEGDWVLLPARDCDEARGTALVQGGAALGAGSGRAAALGERIRRASPRLPVGIARGHSRRNLAIPRPRSLAHRSRAALARVARSRPVARRRCHRGGGRIPLRQLHERGAAVARLLRRASAPSVPGVDERDASAVVRRRRRHRSAPPWTWTHPLCRGR
ncbi:MAG: hypothetical protein E6I84_16890, partial [Chloroflexi bacterium]